MSLLLDALLQAEQNKTKDLEAAEDITPDINSKNDLPEEKNKQNDSHLIELDILPDFEINDDHSESDQVDSISIEPSDNQSALDLQSIEPWVEEDTIVAKTKTTLELEPQELESQELSGSNDEEGNNTEKKQLSDNETTSPTDLPLNNLTIDSDTGNSPTIDFDSLKIEEVENTESLEEKIEVQVETQAEAKKEEIVTEKPEYTTETETQQENSASTPQVSTTTQETVKPSAETDIAKNVLLTSNNKKIKPVYWVILLLLIFLISAGYYLYSQSFPPLASNENIEPIFDPSTMEIEGETSTLKTGSSKTISTNQQKTSTDSVNTLKQSITSSSNKKDKQVSSVDKANATPTFEFTIEPESKGIDYPEAIKIKRKKQLNSEFISLTTAYNAYRNNDVDRAKTLYTRILQKNHRNIDALNALGSIAEQSGNKERAQVFFEQVLKLDGNQVFAKQALIRLQRTPNSSHQESHYKSLINKYPDNAATYANLANAYSAQQQWLKAQKAYFKAIEIDSHNPDYHFNLAISLDHLSKPKIALRYYKKALQLSTNHKPMFSISALQLRIQQLQDL